jgi:uncharacterized protein YjbI with pentapeptide repeats
MTISNEIRELNLILDKVRSGKIMSIEIEIEDKDKNRKIKVFTQNNNTLEKKAEKVGKGIDENKLDKEDHDFFDSKIQEKFKLKRPDISHADFSNMTLWNSYMKGLDMHEADFSYSVIGSSDMSYSDMSNANFYKSKISRTDMSKSYDPNLSSSYMTGSVNLYNTVPKSSGINPLDADKVKGGMDSYGY